MPARRDRSRTTKALARAEVKQCADTERGNNFGRTVTSSYGQLFEEKRSTTKLLVIDDNLAMVTAPPKSSHQALFCLLFCGPGRSPLLLFFLSFVFGPPTPAEVTISNADDES